MPNLLEGYCTLPKVNPIRPIYERKNRVSFLHSEQHSRKANVGQPQPYLLALPRRTNFAALDLCKWSQFFVKGKRAQVDSKCLNTLRDTAYKVLTGG